MMLLELLDDMNLFSGELLKVLTISLNLESSGAPCNTSEPQSRKIFFMRLWEFFVRWLVVAAERVPPYLKVNFVTGLPRCNPKWVIKANNKKQWKW